MLKVSWVFFFSQIFQDVQRELLIALTSKQSGSALCLAIASAVQFIPEDVFKTTNALRNIIKLAFIKGTIYNNFYNL